MYIYGGMRIYACMGVCVGTHKDLYTYVYLHFKNTSYLLVKVAH